MEISIFDIGNVFAYDWRTSKDMEKWMAPCNPARQIGLHTLLKEVLTVDEGVCGLRFQFSILGTFFAYGWRTSKDMEKWMAPFDSAHQIGLNTLLKKVLTLDEGVCTWIFIFLILGTFLPMTGEPVKIQWNGWHHSILRVR